MLGTLVSVYQSELLFLSQHFLLFFSKILYGRQLVMYHEIINFTKGKLQLFRTKLPCWLIKYGPRGKRKKIFYKVWSLRVFLENKKWNHQYVHIDKSYLNIYYFKLLQSFAKRKTRVFISHDFRQTPTLITNL